MNRHAMFFAGVVFLVLIGPVRAAQAQSTVNIGWTNTRQTIDGFGASQAAGDPSDGPDLIAQPLWDWPQTQRNQMLDVAFSQTLGIGLTIFRSKILPTLEATQGNYTPGIDAAQAQLMQQAVLRGPVKLIGSVWSPPAWMKTNSLTYGGNCTNNSNLYCRNNSVCEPGFGICTVGTSDLILSKYPDYAEFLRKYAQTYASYWGLNIYAVSIANEPETSQFWDTCRWTGPQIKTFLRDHLRPTFMNNGVNAKVIAPEPANWDTAEPLLADTYSDSFARSRLDIEAAHVYTGNWANSFPNATTYGKQVWQTEVSLKFPVFNADGSQSWSGAQSWAKLINDQLVNANVSGWIWWLLAGRAGYRGQALIELNDDGINYKVSKTMWALGHFSKFVRPGFVRMNCTECGTGSGPNNVDISAYRDPSTDQFVVVANNRNASAVNVQFNINGMWTAEVTPYLTTSSNTTNLAPQPSTFLQNVQTLPANSITSFVSRTRNFELWASAPNAKALAGDFNGDGKADIALVGGNGWSTIPVALSLGNGTFSVTNFSRADFAGWSTQTGTQVVVGDLNRDGRDDLVVVGGANWTTVNVAYSNGNGSFTTAMINDASIPSLARAQGVKVLSGDMDNDGRDDLVLIGGAGWTTVPVGRTNTNGASFSTTFWTAPAGTITTWAQDPYAKAGMTDFNGDGRADIVLTSGNGWVTIPVAISNANSTFTVYNQSNGSLPVWSQAIGMKLTTGCRRTVALPDHPEWHRCNHNGGLGSGMDTKGDIVFVGGAGWTTIPVGEYSSSGNFSPIMNNAHSSFATWAQDPNAKVVSGDFDGNGRADLALVGGSQWWTVPMAFSFGNGWFSVVNYSID